MGERAAVNPHFTRACAGSPAERLLTVRFALSMHPDVPGVGRLCQELLAELTGQEIALRAPPIERLSGTGHLRNPGNRWGRKGKPK